MTWNEFTTLNKLTNLRELSLANTLVTDDFVLSIAGKLIDIQRLDLSACNKIGKLTVDILLQRELFQKLKYLSLSGCSEIWDVDVNMVQHISTFVQPSGKIVTQ